MSRSKEAADVAQAEQRPRKAEEELKAIEAELEREVQALQDAALDAALETAEIKAKKTGVDVRVGDAGVETGFVVSFRRTKWG